MITETGTDDAAKNAAILRNPMPSVPLLYHYTGRVDAESLLKIIAAELFYFSNPLHFNDVLDMKMPIKVKKAGETNPYFGVISGNNELQNVFDPQLHPGLPELLCNLDDILQSGNEEKIKVLCTTERDTNNLMWSHYGGRHQGISFGLDWSCMFHGHLIPFKVHYQDEYSLSDHGVPTNFLEPPQRFRVKTLDWQSENEWRFFTSVRTLGEAGFVQLRDALKTITLGCNASRETRKLVISLVNRYKPNVEIHQIDIVNGQFQSNVLSMPENFNGMGAHQVSAAIDNVLNEYINSGNTDEFISSCIPYFFHLDALGLHWTVIVAAASLTRNPTLRNRVAQWCPEALTVRTNHARAVDCNKTFDEIDVWRAYFLYIEQSEQPNFTTIRFLNSCDDNRSMTLENRKLFLTIGYKIAKKIESRPKSSQYKNLGALCESNLKMAKKINAQNGDVEACIAMFNKFPQTE